MIRKPQEKLSEKMFECAGSGFKGIPKQKQSKKEKKRSISNTRGEIIIHSTHYLFSDWPKAYSEFSKSAPGTSSLVPWVPLGVDINIGRHF